MVAQFYPSASLRVTDLTLYNQIKADYGLGLGTPDAAGANIITGASPEALAARYGINWVNNPTSSDYNNLPCVFTLTTLSKVLGTAISTSANNVQTLGGQSYTDPNGVFFSTVTWAWQVEVEFFTVLPAGTYEQQVVTWTGDGTLNRLIPTTFPLDSGVVAVWGCGGIDKAGGFNGECNFFRHNGASMLGTALCGLSNNPVSTAIDGAGVDGIISFVAGGFRVSAGSFVFTYGNTNNVKYTAIVLRDTTWDNRYVKVGSYVGLTGASVQASCTHLDPNMTYFGGIVWTNLPKPCTITETATGDVYTMTWSDASNAVISPPFISTTGIKTFTVAISPIATGGLPTHAWVFGGTTSYKSPEMGGTTSVALLSGASGVPPDSTHITAVGAGAITTGAGCQILNRKHNYLALCADATFLALNLFKSAAGVSTGASQVVGGIPFTPALAFVRQGSPAFTDGGMWRHSSQVTLATTSLRCSITGSAVNNDTDGITAMGAASLTFGTAATGTVASDPFWWWAFFSAGASPVVTIPAVPTWTLDRPVPIGDGTTATIETVTSALASPGSTWSFAGPGLVSQWWCNAAFGLSVFQAESPGTGWAACAGPASSNGWYWTTENFSTHGIIVSAGRPADPRPWVKLATWATIGNMNVFGGSPGAACSINNAMIYPASGYVVGTDYPPIRIFKDGRVDKELCRLPPTTANVIPKAVMSMLTANGTAYFTTWDSGTTSADWRGRVFQLDPETGVQTVLGLNFAAGEMPYALAWHMGRLWCGTNNGIGTVGKIYYFRPGIDTTWTQDHSTATDTAGGVTCMASFLGKLYVGTDNAAAAFGKVLVRDTAGAYTTSQTATGGTARVNNGYLAFALLGGNLYASTWNNDTPKISKIEKFTGSAWSTVYTGALLTLRPFVVLQNDLNEIYAIGGGLPFTGALLVTANGTLWTDLTPQLPESTNTFQPMFGQMVT